MDDKETGVEGLVGIFNGLLAMGFMFVIYMLVAACLGGCGILPPGEMGVYHRRIDHAELTQAMTEKPWWCGLFTCDAKGELK